MTKTGNSIKSLTKSAEARVLASNFAWLTLLQIAGYVFPLITMPYLARVIGVDGFGKIAFAAAVIVWVQTIADWGFNLTATRDVAQNRNDKEKVSEIFSNVLWSRCLLMFLSFGFLLLLIVVVPQFRNAWQVLLVSFLLVPGHILFPDWFFQAVEKMKYITIFNVLMKLVFTIAVFVFIKTPDDYILQPLFTSLGYVVSGLISLYVIVGKWGIRIRKPSWQGTLTTIKKSTDVFLNNLAPNLYNSFSVVLLGIFGGGTANGIYDGGNRFYTLGASLMNIFLRTFYPYLSRKPEQTKLYIRFATIVSIALSSLIFIFAPLVVRIFLSAEFVDSVIVLRILSVSLIFIALFDAYGTCYLIINKQERILRRITLGCSLVGFIVAWPLVYCYTYVGAALTVVVSRLLLSICSIVSVGRLEQSKNQIV